VPFSATFVKFIFGRGYERFDNHPRRHGDIDISVHLAVRAGAGRQCLLGPPSCPASFVSFFLFPGHGGDYTTTQLRPFSANLLKYPLRERVLRKRGRVV